MIYLNHDPHVLYYYLKAITNVYPDRQISYDDLVFLVASLIHDDDVAVILKDLESITLQSSYKTGERDYVFFILSSVLQLKQNILANKGAPIAEDKKLISDESSVEFLHANTKRYHYIFSINFYDIWQEQVKIENNFQNKIIQPIVKLKQDLTAFAYGRHYIKQKKALIENSINAINEYLHGSISLWTFNKRINFRYDDALRIGHDTYGAAVLGFFGRPTPLSELINNFITAFTDNVAKLNHDVNQSVHCKISMNKPKRPTRSRLS